MKWNPLKTVQLLSVPVTALFVGMIVSDLRAGAGIQEVLITHGGLLALCLSNIYVYFSRGTSWSEEKGFVMTTRARLVSHLSFTLLFVQLFVSTFQRFDDLPLFAIVFNLAFGVLGLGFSLVNWRKSKA